MPRTNKSAAPRNLFDALDGESGEDGLRDSYQAMRGDAADHARNALRSAHVDMTTDELRELL